MKIWRLGRYDLVLDERRADVTKGDTGRSRGLGCESKRASRERETRSPEDSTAICPLDDVRIAGCLSLLLLLQYEVCPWYLRWRSIIAWSWFLMPATNRAWPSYCLLTDGHAQSPSSMQALLWEGERYAANTTHVFHLDFPREI